ncbi:hypothetical protein D3C81_1413420 [compost metagenome]
MKLNTMVTRSGAWENGVRGIVEGTISKKYLHLQKRKRTDAGGPGPDSGRVFSGCLEMGKCTDDA